MTKPRKTVDVLPVLLRANVALKQPKPSEAERQGICWMLETILHDANAYRGFGYLGEDGLYIGPDDIDKPGFCEYRRVYYSAYLGSSTVTPGYPGYRS